MNEKQRSTLQRFHTDLVKDIIPSKAFLGEFLEKNILTFDHYEEILSEKTNSDKNTKFLLILRSRGPEAFPFLLHVLKNNAPWLQEQLETFYNKQSRFNGDVQSLFNTSSDETSSEETSPKSVCEASVEAEVQTDAVVDESKLKWGAGLNRIYVSAVSYLHSTGNKKFELAKSEVDPDLIKEVVRELITFASIKHERLSKIEDQFCENERETAEGDVVRMMENVLAERESLKKFREIKDLEVMGIEKDHGEEIARLEKEIDELEAKLIDINEEKDKLADTVLENNVKIDELQTEEIQRRNVPLPKKVHNLIEEINDAKNRTEEQREKTGKEYFDLVQESENLDNLLRSAIAMKDQRAEKENVQSQRTVFVRQSLRDRNGYAYNGRVNSQNTNGSMGYLSCTSGLNGNNTSPRLKNRRRLKRSPVTPNRFGPRNSSDTVPTSPKQKTPRYQSQQSNQIMIIPQENRPVTRQNTNYSRAMSRQRTDASDFSNLSPYISRQSTSISRQNSHLSRPTSSRQRISPTFPVSSRNQNYHRNGTDLSFRSEQSRQSIHVGDLCITPRDAAESPGHIFSGTLDTGVPVVISSTEQYKHNRKAQSRYLHSMRN